MVMNSEFLGVFFNLVIAFMFSSIGIAIFAFKWLRNDWYKIPAFEDNEYDSEKDKPVNKLIRYIKWIFEMNKSKNSMLFIKRFGFESYFYLQFHGELGLNFLVSFLAICIIMIAYSLYLTGGLMFGLNRIIGIYYIESKSHFGLNTCIMCTVSFITSYSIWRMMNLFRKVLEMEANSIEESSLTINDAQTNDEYRFIMNTMLLYGCNPSDNGQVILKHYLERLIKQNGIKAQIIDMYTPPDYRELAAELIDLEQSKIYWDNVWWLKFMGKC